LGLPGQIVILNGAPRAGKSSIAAAMQASLPGTWINLGVDVYAKATPQQLSPGIGLRPGGEMPELEPILPVLYAALYDSIAAHARLGLNVVADFGHHDDYSKPLHILPDCARRLAGLPAVLVGVHCPLDVIMARRNASADFYAKGETAPPPVLRWQEAVHVPGIYDLTLDSSELTPEQAAALIGALIEAGAPQPTAFERLAQS
jgi:chloramphenicol 3-O phosphotransferase